MRFAWLLILCALIQPSFMRASDEQRQSVPTFATRLNKPILRFQASGRTLIAVVLDLAYEYGLPTALEYVDSAASTRPLDLNFAKASPREILTQVIASYPEYRVSFSAGVVNIYSPAARADRSNLLNLVVKDFSVAHADTHRADFELFCEVIRQQHAGDACSGSVATGQWGPKKISLQLRGAKVYEILNAIVANNGSAIWIVLAPPDKLATMPNGGLWHIYPLDRSFKEAVLDKIAAVTR